MVWIEDPYGLLGKTDAAALAAEAEARGQPFAVVSNAYRLRQFLCSINPVKSAARFIVVDQSYTSRDPNVLPQDARPSDLVSLQAPDWKPFIAIDARFCPTVRDFLIDATGFDDWPNEVNIYPYERLARDHAAEFVRAYSTFRAMGHTLTSEDLVLVGASAVLQTNLFELTDPLAALELAFHSQSRWDEIGQMFNLAERDVVQRRLQALPIPIGDLFGEAAEVARAAVTGLVVLKQHFAENPGTHLPYASPIFTKYKNCDIPVPAEPSPWFIGEEIPRFEKLMSDEFMTRIKDSLGLEKPENARRFGQEEKYSARLRSLVSFEIERPVLTLGSSRDPFGLDHLVPEFTQAKSELIGIISRTRNTIDNLRLRPTKKLDLKQLLQLFCDSGVSRVDRLLGRLETLTYYIEGPAHPQWSTIPGFDVRWSNEVSGCREAMAVARKLRDELDQNFGRLLEERYAEIVPRDILPTDLFYDKFIAERRRNQDGSLRRAVVLVVDSMRLDIWREIVRPALEAEYDVEETLGFALLPTETRYSRRAFFAGKTPGTYEDARESDLLSKLLERAHGKPVEFEDLQPRRSGMAFGVRSKDSRHTTYAGVFDFPDVLSHEVNWDPHTLHEVQRPLVEKIRALLREVGDDALIFITSDHGHVLQEGGAPVRIRGATDGVGYRAAHVAQRIEGEPAARLFQIEARKLRHNATGWFVFPKPGSALRDAEDESRRFRPLAAYRHGGMSMVEVVIPLACLRHRSMVTRVSLTPIVRQRAVVAKPLPIELAVTADTLLASPVFIAADQDAVESAWVSGASTKPQTVVVTFLPTSPGKNRITFTALMAGEKVGEAAISIDVAAARVPDEDIARAKLAKLFGDD